MREGSLESRQRAYGSGSMHCYVDGMSRECLHWNCLHTAMVMGFPDLQGQSGAEQPRCQQL